MGDWAWTDRATGKRESKMGLEVELMDKQTEEFKCESMSMRMKGKYQVMNTDREVLNICQRSENSLECFSVMKLKFITINWFKQLVSTLVMSCILTVLYVAKG